MISQLSRPDLNCLIRVDEDVENKNGKIARLSDFDNNVRYGQYYNDSELDKVIIDKYSITVITFKNEIPKNFEKEVIKYFEHELNKVKKLQHRIDRGKTLFYSEMKKLKRVNE